MGMQKKMVRPGCKWYVQDIMCPRYKWMERNIRTWCIRFELNSPTQKTSTDKLAFQNLKILFLFYNTTL